MKKIVIIGANDFQKPLIQKAKEMGYRIMYEPEVKMIFKS